MARASDSASGPALGKSARVPPAAGSGLVPAKGAGGQRAVERPSRPARFRLGRVSRLWATAQQFLTDVRAEMKRVAWPDRQTVIASTIVVLFVLTVTAVYLAGWDYLFGELFSYLFKH
jgi:preprotein translocase SecE subunit